MTCLRAYQHFLVYNHSEIDWTSKTYKKQNKINVEIMCFQKNRTFSLPGPIQFAEYFLSNFYSHLIFMWFKTKVLSIYIYGKFPYQVPQKNRMVFYFKKKNIIWQRETCAKWKRIKLRVKVTFQMLKWCKHLYTHADRARNSFFRTM